MNEKALQGARRQLPELSIASVPEARKFFKLCMGEQVTEMPDGTLSGSVDAEVAIAWLDQCMGLLMIGIGVHFERQYKPFDQMSIKELEAIATRLNAIIGEAKSKR